MGNVMNEGTGIGFIITRNEEWSDDGKIKNGEDGKKNPRAPPASSRLSAGIWFALATRGNTTAVPNQDQSKGNAGREM